MGPIIYHEFILFVILDFFKFLYEIIIRIDNAHDFHKKNLMVLNFFLRFFKYNNNILKKESDKNRHFNSPIPKM